MDVTRKAWTAFAIALEGGVHKSLLPAAGAAVKSAYDVCVYDPTFSNVRVWDSEGRVNMRFAHGALESLSLHCFTRKVNLVPPFGSARLEHNMCQQGKVMLRARGRLGWPRRWTNRG